MLKLFRWISLEPDLRKWKPSRPVFEPQEMFVAVEVPDEHLTKGGHLTLEGMRFCIDQFEGQMSEPTEMKADAKEDWDNKTESEDEEWD